MKSRIFKTAGFRYAVLSALVFAVSAILLGVFVYYSVRENMERQLRDHLNAETRQLLGDYADHGIEELRHDIRERVERNPSPRLYYTLQNADGVAVFDRFTLLTSDGWSRVSVDGAPDRILLTTTLEDGFRLGVAASTRNITELSRALRQSLALSVFAIFLFSAVAGGLVSRRFLARVELFKETAEKVGGGTLSERISETGTDDEFDQLARTINRMLDRIERLMNDVRYVSVSIAHDLRTPLGKLRQRLEKLSAMQENSDTREICKDAIESLDHTLETFSSLLKIGELDSGSAAINLESVDISKLLERLGDVYTPIAEERGHQLTCVISDAVTIAGDRQLLTQLFSNLIENSINHNTEGVNIVLQTRMSADGVEATIADTGVGILEGSYEEVLKPFHRLDASRHMPGSGLGLALVASIASKHDAKIYLENNDPGLRVTLRFSGGRGL